ncbi:hypothetical protein G4O51_01275 [Candidatus Bathyarchaeota archaeon A05DMB-2]|jgi:hypothetical protein|nr:hypothetical protein [Candidatus Bathyarchaeota archaeon A05DMB-2]
MIEKDNAWFERAQLKERELTKMFENIKEELALITASAKFNFAIRKTSEKDLNIILAYIEDTGKLVDLLRSRLIFLSESIS